MINFNFMASVFIHITLPQILNSTGLRDTDPRLKECMRNFREVENSVDYETIQDSLGSTLIDKKTFKE